MRVAQQYVSMAALASPSVKWTARVPVQRSEYDQMRPDPVASKILCKAGLGKRVNRSEISYVSETRPDQAGLLSKTTAERDALTRRMRKSSSKSEVRMVHLGAVVTAGKTSVTAGEAETRVNQLNDAKVEYMQTREYKRKPELPPKSLKRRPGEGEGTLRPAGKVCTKELYGAKTEGGNRR